MPQYQAKISATVMITAENVAQAYEALKSENVRVIGSGSCLASRTNHDRNRYHVSVQILDTRKSLPTRYHQEEKKEAHMPHEVQTTIEAPTTEEIIRRVRMESSPRPEQAMLEARIVQLEAQVAKLTVMRDRYRKLFLITAEMIRGHHCNEAEIELRREYIDAQNSE